MKTITITDCDKAEALYRNFLRMEDTNLGEFSFLKLFFEGGEELYLHLNMISKIKIAEEIEAG